MKRDIPTPRQLSARELSAATHELITALRSGVKLSSHSRGVIGVSFINMVATYTESELAEVLQAVKAVADRHTGL